METNTEETRSRHAHKVLLGLCLAGFSYIAVTLYGYLMYKHTVVRDAKKSVQSEIDDLTGSIEKALALVSTETDAIATESAAAGANEKDLERKSEAFAASNAGVLALDRLFLSPGPDGKPAFRAFSSRRENGKVRTSAEDGDRGYAKEAWFENVFANGPLWSPPFWDEGSKNYAVVYGVPIFRGEAGKRERAGAVFAVVSLAPFREMMDSMGLNKDTFGMILARDGTVLYHPVAENIVNRTNIFELLERNRDMNRNYEKQRAITLKAVNGEAGDGYTIGRTGQPFWYFFRPIRQPGWSVLVYFVKDTIPMNGQVLRRQEIRIAAALSVTLVLFAALCFRLYDPKKITHGKLWFIAISFSVFALATAGYTCALTLDVPLKEREQNKVVIDDPVSLNRFFASSTKTAMTLRGQAPVYLPTGIYIENIDFVNSSNVALTGYVWQRFRKGVHDNVARGFLMPEAKDFTASEAYRVNKDGEEVIGWHFQAMLRPPVNYSKYPFDHPDIAVWLRHADLFNKVILVPDLKGYFSTNAVLSPGLRPRLSLPGYSFSGTFFSYEPKFSNVNFGASGEKRGMAPQEMVYNILIKRNFITPLVSKFFPICIVLGMLFIVILSFSEDTERLKNFGLTGFAVVGLVVSFFFSTLLTQIDLRQQFNADGIIFIENFNFITYLILLFTAMLAYLFATKRRIRFVHYEHCLIPKLLYWPIFSSMVLFVSLLYFY